MIPPRSNNYKILIRWAVSGFLVISLSLVLFMTIDFFLGVRLRALIDPQRDQFRVSHPVYHHDLSPSFKGVGHWGTWAYPVCTDVNGFKNSCEKTKLKEKNFDVAFIGDSFTEGIGLPYEKTFVGIVANRFPQLKVANLGVVSYSPAIYLSKLTYLFAQGYRFKHIIVFIDIADIYDEANSYDLYDNKQVVDKGETYPFSKFKQARRWAIRHFPLTALGWDKAQGFFIQNFKLDRARSVISDPVTLLNTAKANETVAATSSQSSQPPQQKDAARADAEPSRSLPPTVARNIYEGIYEKNYPKSEWTYNTESIHYGNAGVLGTLDKMKLEMTALLRLAKAHGAEVSVGVYPWPGQLKFDNNNSMHVRFWKEFCVDQCLHFYNAFPAFFSLVNETDAQRVIMDYYFAGDVHFSEQGNQVLADVVSKTGLK